MTKILGEISISLLCLLWMILVNPLRIDKNDNINAHVYALDAK